MENNIYREFFDTDEKYEAAYKLSKIFYIEPFGLNSLTPNKKQKLIDTAREYLRLPQFKNDKGKCLEYIGSLKTEDYKRLEKKYNRKINCISEMKDTGNSKLKYFKDIIQNDFSYFYTIIQKYFLGINDDIILFVTQEEIDKFRKTVQKNNEHQLKQILTNVIYNKEELELFLTKYLLFSRENLITNFFIFHNIPIPALNFILNEFIVKYYNLGQQETTITSFQDFINLMFKLKIYDNKFILSTLDIICENYNKLKFKKHVQMLIKFTIMNFHYEFNDMHLLIRRWNYEYVIFSRQIKGAIYKIIKKDYKNFIDNGGTKIKRRRKIYTCEERMEIIFKKVKKNTGLPNIEFYDLSREGWKELFSFMTAIMLNVIVNFFPPDDEYFKEIKLNGQQYGNILFIKDYDISDNDANLWFINTFIHELSHYLISKKYPDIPASPDVTFQNVQKKGKEINCIFFILDFFGLTEISNSLKKRWAIEYAKNEIYAELSAYCFLRFFGILSEHSLPYLLSYNYQYFKEDKEACVIVSDIVTEIHKLFVKQYEMLVLEEKAK